MFGHGTFDVDPDFWVGAGVPGVGVVVFGAVVVGVVEDVLDPVVGVVLVLVAADAPAIPAAAPPVASAPATIVAPSIFEMRRG
jgi:hypothetical protein